MVAFNSKNTSFEALEKEYDGFIAPAFKVVINNKDIVREGMAIEEVSVELSTNGSADTASFGVGNAYDLIHRDFNLEWTSKYLKLGNAVEIHMGYTDKLTLMFYGYITNLEYDFSSGTPMINITAMDLSFFMMRSGIPEKWKDMKISDIVTKIGRKYGFSDFKMNMEKEILSELSKNNESDHEFLLQQAKNRSYDFYAVGKTLYFRDKEESKPSLMKLEWGKNLKSFRVEHDIADQLTAVYVRGNIEDTSEVVLAKSTKIRKIGKNSITGSDIMKKMGEFVEVLQENVKDYEEAEQLADARLDDAAKKLVTANGSCIGIPEIRPGLHLDIAGAGRRLDTSYEITGVSHRIDGSGYTTSFTLQGNAV